MDGARAVPPEEDREDPIRALFRFLEEHGWEMADEGPRSAVFLRDDGTRLFLEWE